MGAIRCIYTIGEKERSVNRFHLLSNGFRANVKHRVPKSCVEPLETRRLLAAATFPIVAQNFVEDASRKIVYATDPGNNAVAVINAATLTFTGEIPVGAAPVGLALSRDGSTLYVADAQANQIDVIDTTTLTAGTPLTLPANDLPSGVQVGTNNRLWVLANATIIQIDATTGASTGPNLASGGGLPALNLSNGGANIAISPDGGTLYVGQIQANPTYLYQFNVSGGTGTEVWATQVGSVGLDLALSSNASLVTLPCFSNSNIQIYQTSNHTIAHTLNTAGSNTSFAFSPDNKFGYAGALTSQGGTIETFDLSTNSQVGGFSIPGTPASMLVDSTGQYLFASIPAAGVTEVFATGRTIPVPPIITTQPQGVSVSAGSSATFTAAASGTPFPSEQWQQSTDGGSTWGNINGGTNTTYTVPQAGPDNGYEFRAVFTNAGGAVTSNAAALTVVNNGKLAFTQQPTGTVSGNLLTPSLVVDVEDASGNLMASDNSTVTLSIFSGPSGATLAGGGQVNAVNGVATFPAVSLPTAGNYVIKASDGVLTPAYTSSFTSTGVPSLSIVQQPIGGTAGLPITPAIVVHVNTAAGSLATTDESFVTLSIFSGPAGADLGGVVTVNAVNGVATFGDVIPTEPGTYVLQATDTSDEPAKTASFQVAAGSGGATTTTLISNTASASSGSPVVFTATVTAGAGTPTGTVQFFDEGVSLGMASLSGGMATLSTSALPAGVQYITAAYFGGSGFSGSTSAPLAETVASQASLAASVSGNDPAIFVPGNPGSAIVNIVNQGAAKAHGRVGLKLYATTDGVATDGVLLAARPTEVSINLRGGASKAVHVSFIVPPDFVPGPYTLMAVLTPLRGLTAANISSTPQVASPFSNSTFALSFGSVGGRHGVKLMRVEPDGTIVTYTLTGPGTGTVSGNGINSPDVSLSGTTSASRFAITTRGGSGGVTLAGLSDNSSLGSINAPATTFAGVVHVAGSINHLVLDSLTGSNFAVGSIGSAIIEGSLANSKLLAGTSFGIDGLPGGGDDTYSAGSINAIRILGNVNGSIIAAGLNPVDGIYLNGNDTLVSGGRIGVISISGTLSADSRVLASDLPRTARVGASPLATAADPRFTD